MVIFMTHPLHGAMHVYAEAEAAENEKNGWKREAEPQAVTPQPALEAIPAFLKRSVGRPRKE